RTIWMSVVSATAALSACTPRNPFSAMPSVTSTSDSRRLQTGSGTSCTIELCSGGSTRGPISLPASENVRKRCSRTSVNDQPVRSVPQEVVAGEVEEGLGEEVEDRVGRQGTEVADHAGGGHRAGIKTRGGRVPGRDCADWKAWR